MVSIPLVEKLSSHAFVSLHVSRRYRTNTQEWTGPGASSSFSIRPNQSAFRLGDNASGRSKTCSSLRKMDCASSEFERSVLPKTKYFTSQLDHCSTHCRHTTHPLLCYMKTTKDQQNQAKFRTAGNSALQKSGFLVAEIQNLNKNNISVEKRLKHQQIQKFTSRPHF